MNPSDLTDVMSELCAAEAPVRILRHLAWPRSVRHDFLARGGRELPRIEYAPFDAAPTLERIGRVRQRLGTPDSSTGRWIARQADAIENGALMLQAIGTADFLRYSCALYGAPEDVPPYETQSTLKFAQDLDAIIGSLVHVDLGAPADTCHLSTGLADAMRAAVRERFGEAAPEVVVVDELSANALAGPETIRIRRNACFTDRDVHQLIEHEAFVHVLTSLNGRAQTKLPILGSSQPGTTRTQEGLAVFAELITGSMDVDRMRRLADRVIAIQMAIDGADFLEVYRYFLERTGNEEQSFENTRRVFRGGRIEGGVPFTKDIVYLDGLLRVQNFMHTSVSLGRADLLRLLFVGKLDIEDVPALAELSANGMCVPPVYLPPWANDLRFLLSYLAHSSFLTTVDPHKLRAHYAEIAAAAPYTHRVRTGSDASVASDH